MSCKRLFWYLVFKDEGYNNMIRIKWAQEEMVAMVGLYFRNKAGLIDDMEIEYVMLYNFRTSGLL